MIYLSLGRRARGKSTLAYYMARKLPARLIFDPRGLFRREGAIVVRSRESLAPAVELLATGAAAEVVYSPVDELGEAFTWFSLEARRLVVAYPERRIGIVVDEVSFVKIDGAFEWILKTCDPRQVHVFLTCHRPADLPVTVRAISDFWCIFQTTQEHDLQVISERCGRAVASHVAHLDGHNYLCWDDGRTTFALYELPARWNERLKDKPGAAIEWDSELTASTG